MKYLRRQTLPLDKTLSHFQSVGLTLFGSHKHVVIIPELLITSTSFSSVSLIVPGNAGSFSGSSVSLLGSEMGELLSFSLLLQLDFSLTGFSELTLLFYMS